VVSLRAQRGAGAPGGRVALEAAASARCRACSPRRASAARARGIFRRKAGHTDNERANNAFDSANTVVRLDHKLSDRASVGATVRWFHGVYGSPGDRYTNDPDNEEREENVLATAFADLNRRPTGRPRSSSAGRTGASSRRARAPAGPRRSRS